jgi:hypothetical protein
LNWILDFGLGATRCIGLDWNDARADGCPSTSTPLWIVVSDSFNNAMVASIAGQVAGNEVTFDLSFVTNGGPGDFGPGTNPGRAVQVLSSSTAAGKVTVNFAPLAVPNYGDTVRPLPGTQRMRGTNNALPVTSTGTSIVVDQNTDVCWEIVDAALTVPIGCVHVGGLTPSQNLQNAKATLGKGQLNFSWDVSAQFDVLGFNVIQKNLSKGTERTVNSTLIPINGMNDAQAATYKFSAGRNDLQATRGGFEIEMVRVNGETSRTPAPLINK